MANNQGIVQEINIGVEEKHGNVDYHEELVQLTSRLTICEQEVLKNDNTFLSQIVFYCLFVQIKHLRSRIGPTPHPTPRIRPPPSHVPLPLPPPPRRVLPHRVPCNCKLVIKSCGDKSWATCYSAKCSCRQAGTGKCLSTCPCHGDTKKCALKEIACKATQNNPSKAIPRGF